MNLNNVLPIDVFDSKPLIDNLKSLNYATINSANTNVFKILDASIKINNKRYNGSTDVQFIYNLIIFLENKLYQDENYKKFLRDYRGGREDIYKPILTMYQMAEGIFNNKIKATKPPSPAISTQQTTSPISITSTQSQSPSQVNTSQPSTSQIAQNLQNIMPNQPTPGQQQAPSSLASQVYTTRAQNQPATTSGSTPVINLTSPQTSPSVALTGIGQQQLSRQAQNQQNIGTSQPLSNNPPNQNIPLMSASSIAPSQAISISTLRETTDQQVLNRLKSVSNATFDIKNDLEDFNDYVLSQVAKKQAINYDTVQAVRRKYPFIMTDEYERNILGYNGIINTGIVSNIPVNFKDLVLPIPSYTQNIPDQKDKQVQLNLKQAIDRGYQIVSSKDGFKNDYITFKQKEGQSKFVGSYIHPKLKGKFRVRYEGKNNTFVISNPNYPTGYVKTGFQIYSYLNSLVKKQEKESKKPFVYMPRIAVAYQ